MTLRCYVASAFPLRGEVRAIHAKLEGFGLIATSSWANAEGTGPETVTEESAEAIYTQNDADVARSHVMLVVAREGLGAEMFAECRFALTLRIPVLWTGNRTCLSTYRPGVVRCSSLDSALSWLATARLDVSRPFPTPDAWKRDVLWSRALNGIGSAAPVPRGHCGRCDRCGWTAQTPERAAIWDRDGWHFGTPEHACACRPGDCGKRPLPALRTHCAGCGAPYEAIPAAPADDADDTIPRLSLSDIYEGRT